LEATKIITEMKDLIVKYATIRKRGSYQIKMGYNYIILLVIIPHKFESAKA